MRTYIVVFAQVLDRRTLQILVLAILVSVAGFGGEVLAKDGAWQQSYKVRARMVAGANNVESANDAEGATRLAFVQLELEPGWKTYWRHPGEAGGIPPEFTWAGSTNLSGATVLYPTPHRMSEEIGDTIGYKNRVIFPVRVTANDASKPISLQLALKFGICKDICVPSEAQLVTTVPTVISQSLPEEFRDAFNAVPRAQPDLKPKDPMLQSVHAPKKQGDSWKIGFKTKHQDGAEQGDLFLEAPAGFFIPMPKKMSTAQGPHQSFEITLSHSEYQDLKGKSLQATVVDSLGASEAEFVLR